MRCARLLPECTHLYPTLGIGWIPVVREEPDGVWIQGPAIGDSLLAPHGRLVAREHLEIAD